MNACAPQPNSYVETLTPRLSKLMDFYYFFGAHIYIHYFSFLHQKQVSWIEEENDEAVF